MVVVLSRPVTDLVQHDLFFTPEALQAYSFLRSAQAFAPSTQVTRI